MGRYESWHLLESERIVRAFERKDLSASVLDRHGRRTTLDRFTADDMRYWGTFEEDYGRGQAATGTFMGKVAAMPPTVTKSLAAQLDRIAGRRQVESVTHDVPPTSGVRLPVMRRKAMRVLASGGVLAVTLATGGVARAASEVVVAVSPTSVALGQSVDVLVRTFFVVNRTDLSLPVQSPPQPYPVASGVWDILYPWPDYPFDVIAQDANGTQVPVAVARDPTDSTLWRGVLTPTKAGTWTIWVRNFPNKEPGSTAVVTVQAGPSASALPVPGSATTAGSANDAVPAALVGLLLGLLVGGLVGARPWRRRLPF